MQVIFQCLPTVFVKKRVVSVVDRMFRTMLICTLYNEREIKIPLASRSLYKGMAQFSCQNVL